MADISIHPVDGPGPSGHANKCSFVANDFYWLEDTENGPLVHLKGDWVIENASVIEKAMPAVQRKTLQGAPVCCAHIGTLDTAGAVMIRRFSEGEFCSIDGNLIGVQERHESLLNVIRCTPVPAPTEPEQINGLVRLARDLGLFAEHVMLSTANLVGFIGLVLTRSLALLRYPRRFRVTPMVYQLDVVGLRALGIVGLISFLIGAVLVNQGAIQLAKFGADLFVIDMIGILHLREMGVLLTSIIIAGRSGSAFCAQLGSMRLREEVDAIVTLGMNPIDVLVLPRLFALLIALPLLTFYADIVGLMGGALMAWAQLGISPPSFFSYFNEVIVLDNLLVGLIKAPFNALIIVVTGCYQGLTVAGSADTLGAHTTRSVVQAIFLVIVVNALFAMFFTTIGM